MVTSWCFTTAIIGRSAATGTTLLPLSNIGCRAGAMRALNLLQLIRARGADSLQALRN